MALSVVLVFVLWLLTRTTIETVSTDALERAVDVDLAGLVDIYASGGNDELANRINDRLAFTASDGNAPHYLLETNAGAKLAGDLQQWPALSARFSEAGLIHLPTGAGAQARATQLGPDLRLLVAREYGDTTALQNRVALVFLLGGISLILAVGLIGRAAARRLSARIGRVNAAFRDPESGLGGFIPRAGRPDEIDELTGNTAAALGRMNNLVEAHRETSEQIAHEIRTPLMHLDSKIVRALNAHQDKSVLLAARDDIKRLVGMLESLLDIASSKARQGETHSLRPVDLSVMVTRLGELYADSAEESGHIFTCRITPGVTMDGEEMQLMRLVTNLLDNAFKYAPSGCTVTLSLAPGPVLAVCDNGPGVPENMQEKIFERFQRGDYGESERQGAGLGLALASAIARRHGMTIKFVDQLPGAGFIVSRGG